MTICEERDFLSRRRRAAPWSSAMIILYVCRASFSSRFFFLLPPLLVNVHPFSFSATDLVSPRSVIRARVPCTRETPRYISSIFKQHGLSARGSASIYKASGALGISWCRRGGLTSSRTRHPHRTRICHQINTMSSRHFLPSSPSCDLFLALSVLHFSLRLRSLSLPLSFYVLSSRSSPAFAPLSRQCPLFHQALSFFLSFFVFLSFHGILSRARHGDGRWLQPCTMLSLKVTRSRQYFVFLPFGRFFSRGAAYRRFDIPSFSPLYDISVPFAFNRVVYDCVSFYIG